MGTESYTGRINRKLSKKLRIVEVAAGREKADLVLKNASYVNVFSNEICQGDIAVAEGLIVGMGSYSGEAEADMSGKIVLPGFIDAHIHLESAMVSPGEFARAVLPHGSTTVIVDPHEIANVMGADGIEYALEGSVFMAGALIQWLRDEMRLVDSSPDSEYMARKVKNTNGCYVVPAFTGLGAPHWDMNARGAILGLTRGAGRNHIIRAALESIAYQTADVLRAMEEDAGIPLRELRVDGGASANSFLMQFQADLVDRPLSRPNIRETTALGAAYLAGLATGVWKNLEDIRGSWTLDRRYQPAMEGEQRENLLSGWHEAVGRVRSRK